MTKVLRLTALAATVAALAVTATEAAAAPVSATANATARARILRPLTLTSTQNFDLGIIVLAGAGAYTATVGLDRAGTFNCDSNSGNVACSGTPVRAIYNVTGTQGQNVTIASGPVSMTNGTDTLTLTPDHNTTVTLANSGAPGSNFFVGGSLSIPSTTSDGVYTGTFALTADYQ
jgi:Mat/Ecp fimbriae major subunit